VRPRDQLDDAESRDPRRVRAGEPLIDAIEAPEDAPVLARRRYRCRWSLHLKGRARIIGPRT
jgi:hypothetical protein